MGSVSKTKGGVMDTPGDRQPSDDPPSPDPVLGEAEIASVVLDEAKKDHRLATEEDLYLYRTEYYERERHGRRTDRQLGFLFLLIVVLFLVLAFRVESNDSRLAQGLHNACTQRVSTANQYNVAREALVQVVITGPAAPKDAAAKALMAKQLRDALLLPIEDCGPPPN